MMTSSLPFSKMKISDTFPEASSTRKKEATPQREKSRTSHQHRDETEEERGRDSMSGVGVQSSKSSRVLRALLPYLLARALALFIVFGDRLTFSRSVVAKKETQNNKLVRAPTSKRPISQKAFPEGIRYVSTKKTR
jgi:hypothetical protein